MTPPQKEGPGVVFPVPSVPSVPFVPSSEEGGNKRNRRNERNKEQYLLTSELGFLQGKSDRELYAILLYDHQEGLTHQEAAVLLDSIKQQVGQAEGAKPEAIKQYVYRLNDNPQAMWVQTVGTGTPQKHTLTGLGRAQIEKLYLEYRQSTAEQARQEHLIKEATPKYNLTHDLPEQISIFKEFFELNEQHMSALLENLRQGNSWVSIPYNDLAKHSPEMAELLLEQPAEVLKAWQIAIEKIDPPRAESGSAKNDVQIRITGLPETVRLSSLGTANLERLVQVEAQVLTISERRAMMTGVRFECPSCGNILYVMQTEQKYKEPSRCSCGRKGKFKQLEPDLVDACTVLLSQPLTELVGKKVKPSQLKVILKSDLTRDDVRDHLGLNSMVRMVGILHKIPIILPSGGQSTRFDVMLEAVSVELLDHYNPHLALSPERIQQIKDDAAHPRFKERMIESCFPRHVGDESLKLQLLCMSVAMPLHLNSAENRAQADCEALNIIVAGDPGMGKSRLGSRVLELIPHGGRATGAGASKAGLTIAADNKDKENDLVIPQPGALPSANMGIFILDELDKMELNEQTVLNEVLSEHTVSIAKRGANTTLPARICFIGFANPRVKTWDLSKQSIQNELNIHYSLLTRCIINVQSDVSDEKKDRLIAKAVLNKAQQVLTPFDDQYMRDILLYIRGTVHPKLRERDAQLIEDMYANLRKILPIKAICPRFIEQVHSLSLLHAKLHLRNETRKEDVDFARDIMLRSLATSGYESAGLNVKEEQVTTQREDVAAFIRAEAEGARYEDVYQHFPEALIKTMLEQGELFDAKGRLRVLE
jgi:DNA replicative helicase MCM subunit Mcm2 (Cdc46/Mcm family)